VTRARIPSPTAALAVGLLLTLGTVVVYWWYVSGQIAGLRRTQTELTDRNRRDSLQLLRIQNDLNQIAIAMRDMLDADQPYPLVAWSAQFDRIRVDLEDALAREGEVAVARRTPEQSQYLATSTKQFWEAVDRMFELAKAGREEEARGQIRVTLQSRQAALSTAVARLLVQNNESEERTAQQVQNIYADVQRNASWLLTATLAAIAVTGLYLIRSNRKLFARLSALSDQRRDLAQALITTREATLREISRELHDEFGQVLTAIGLMLGRAAKQIPDGSPLRKDLREIGEVAQAALDNVRGLSQTLHPSILEELGLESTIQWYLSTAGARAGRDARACRAAQRQPGIPHAAGPRYAGASPCAPWEPCHHMSDKITVLLVDDHALVRRGFRRLLEDDDSLSVVGEASDGEEAIRMVEELKPQVVVMDAAMPGTGGLAATRAILAKHPEAAILMLSMHSEETLVGQALDAGAKGYILKNALDLDLAAAVKRVAAGEQVLDPAVVKSESRSGERTRLSPRELEVLQLICDGLSNREIAGKLGLSVNTVAVHRANIMNTLGVHKTAELVVYAIQNGLVNPL
jgi:DNA-binding NarL/FixJ family response regulator/signal transduction histidine kinase